MEKFLVVFLAALVCINAKVYEELYLESAPKINKMQNKWRAGYNSYFKGMDLEVIKKMMGGRASKDKTPAFTPKIQASLPATFDSRTQWPQCPSISHIRDQGNCGGCWAVSAAEVATDRTCIHSNGAFDVELSAEDILSCCTYCGSGCGGGYPISAMQFWQESGVVTGGDYDSNQGCYPYEIPPTGLAGKAGQVVGNAPTCYSQCESGYSNSFNNDKHYASTHYYVTGGVAGIQQEIYTNGPVQALFHVYEDFMNYRSGVYKYTYGNYLDNHVIKIFGWGTLDNTPYWLAANSWNTSWGMSGFFMIERGVDECGIEDEVVAGLSAN